MDPVPGLVPAYLTRVSGVAAGVLTTTFLMIPREVEGAAALDGRSAWQTLTRVTLRLALPVLLLTALLQRHLEATSLAGAVR
jgi:ABC-type maltose transport system permease subunit